jgi:hypothetical protein
MKNRMLGNALRKLPKKYQWVLHNIVGHPVMEIVYQLGFGNLANDIHDWTAPTPDSHST